MFVRLVVSMALAYGLLVAPLVAGAQGAGRGALEGRTSQGYRVALRMQGAGSFKLLRFTASLKCRDGPLLRLEESGFLPTPLHRGGRFKDAQFGNTDAVRFKGRVTRGAVRGRIRLEDKLGKKKIHCSSRWIGFHVKR
ncbi:MAG TPA: hypothetical protein VG518_07540 [Solirubrobacterales bacterium]|nr:hypothetical protein [Solirubrobacterales bacterium]